MNCEVFAVLLDTMSIQRYIFSTNNLKENIGASHIVKEIYDSHLKEVIKEILNPPSDYNYYDAWEKNPEKIKILEPEASFEIGYIGGGNALIFFKNKNIAEEFLKKWSMRLLVHCPGLIPASAIGKIDFNNFSGSIRELFIKLSERKSSFIPETIIRRHGITAECPNTGYSAEIWCEKLPEEKKSYISSVSNAKIMAVEQADKKLKKILEECDYHNKYTFTNELDKLGQKRKQDSHIAIVFIDGNDMGERFRSQKDLPSLRELSKSVRDATMETFKKVIKAVVEAIEEKVLEDEGIILENSKKEDERDKTILPIRPIIIGGDDILFVSDGRLGIWLAKIFLEEFQKKQVSDFKPLSACAGVAITKTKYPFYRGYKLSEDLIRNAKDKRKELKDNGSWIDFHISYGGFSGELKEIRKEHYKNPENISLILRPYSISALNELLNCVATIVGKNKGKEKFPRSKIMELRDVLYSGKQAHRLFIEEMKARGLKLPSYKDFDGYEIIKDSETPYLDMIELTEFYPKFALQGGNL
jgi:hypothetical protein